jgi:hypothetical protein
MWDSATFFWGIINAYASHLLFWATYVILFNEVGLAYTLIDET